MFAPTDEAFEELFVILNRGLEELLSNPTFLCNLVAYLSPSLAVRRTVRCIVGLVAFCSRAI